MAAPDRVYRYFTNLKLQDNLGTVQYIRCAKPLSSYITINISYSSKLHELMRKFKIDGILWVKNNDNPVAPYTDADAPDNTVEIIDPADPNNTITMLDPDLNDQDRTGFIAYVYPQEYSTSGYYKFHDIRMPGEFSSNTEPNSINYDKRPWSRASALRFRKSGDSGPAIILNDAGLNRLGEAEVDMSYNPYVELGDGVSGKLYYTGSFTSPTYNKITSYGIKYKFTSGAFSTLADMNEHTIALNKVVPKGATVLYGNNDNPLVCNLDADGVLRPDNTQWGQVVMSAGDKVYFRPFAKNEEGLYEDDYDEDYYVIVPRCKFKCHWLSGWQQNTSNNRNSVRNYLDQDASKLDSTTDEPFCEEAAAYLNISDDNAVNLQTDYGTMYLNNRLSPSITTEQMVNPYAYNSADLSSSTRYKIGTLDECFGFHHGPLLQTQDGKFYYIIVFTEDQQDPSMAVKIIYKEAYYPRIPGRQGLFLSNNYARIAYFGQMPMNVEASFTVNNYSTSSSTYNITIKLYKEQKNVINPTRTLLKTWYDRETEQISARGEKTYDNLTFDFGTETYTPNDYTYFIETIFGIDFVNDRSITERWNINDSIHPSNPEL